MTERDIRRNIKSADKEKRRRDNRKMIERGEGIHIEDITQVSSTINIQGRRTRGRGRWIHPKK